MRALIIVDVQNDFCPGGTLAVPNGDSIIPGIKEYGSQFDRVITTQDWHPQNHGSFASNHPGCKPFEMGRLFGRAQVMWPDHCVQRTHGAAFHPLLEPWLEIHGDANFVKGTYPSADSYSGFFDDDGRNTGLDKYLKENGITEVNICGLATDYCVKFTALDAVHQGYLTTVTTALCRPVNLNPGDENTALEELRKAGVRIR